MPKDVFIFLEYQPMTSRCMYGHLSVKAAKLLKVGNTSYLRQRQQHREIRSPIARHRVPSLRSIPSRIGHKGRRKAAIYIPSRTAFRAAVDDIGQAPIAVFVDEGIEEAQWLAAFG